MTTPTPSAPVTGEWQPIDSAPRDDTDVLLFWFDKMADIQIVAAWDAEKGLWMTLDGLGYMNSSFSHWQPLPPPPPRP